MMAKKKGGLIALLKQQCAPMSPEKKITKKNNKKTKKKNWKNTK